MAGWDDLLRGLFSSGGQGLGNGNQLPSTQLQNMSYGPQQPGWQQYYASQPQQSQQQGYYQPQPSPLESLATFAPFLNLPNQQSKYMQPAYDTFAAAANSNSPQYQQVYGEQKQQGQQNLAESIAELSRQNRKLSMMGRAPLFSPERGGEQQFRNITQGYQDIQNKGANDTRGILGTLAQNQMLQGQQQGQIATNKAGIQGGLFGAGAKAAIPFLSHIFGL